jgi:sugar transferase (PEP-CTERM/EpsH1 system associated)
VNVLFLTHRLPYAPNRGDRIRAYYLLREMSRFADVSLFSFVHDADEAAEAARMPFACRVRTARVSKAANALRAGARLLSDRPLTHSLLDAPGIAGTLASLVQEARPDVIVAYCSGMARLALEPPLETFPCVLDMVDVDSAKWRQMARTASPVFRRLYRREGETLAAFETQAVSRAAMTLVVNERERSALAAIATQGTIEVLQNGVDVDAFRAPASAAAAREPRVVFCGVLNYHPNEAGVLWFLNEVWSTVAAARPDARFTIVGAHPTGPIRRAAAKHASVDLAGGVAAVQPYLWRSAVSAAPLHLARGLQNKVLEALAAGLPVVATPVVIEGLPVTARSACTAASTPMAFAQALIDGLAEPPAERAARIARVDLDALSWSNRLAGLREILRQAAAGAALAIAGTPASRDDRPHRDPGARVAP